MDVAPTNAALGAQRPTTESTLESLPAVEHEARSTFAGNNLNNGQPGGDTLRVMARFTKEIAISTASGPLTNIYLTPEELAQLDKSVATMFKEYPLWEIEGIFMTVVNAEPWSTAAHALAVTQQATPLVPVPANEAELKLMLERGRRNLLISNKSSADVVLKLPIHSQGVKETITMYDGKKRDPAFYAYPPITIGKYATAQLGFCNMIVQFSVMLAFHDRTYISGISTTIGPLEELIVKKFRIFPGLDSTSTIEFDLDRLEDADYFRNVATVVVVIDLSKGTVDAGNPAVGIVTQYCNSLAVNEKTLIANLTDQYAPGIDEDTKKIDFDQEVRFFGMFEKQVSTRDDYRMMRYRNQCNSPFRQVREKARANFYATYDSNFLKELRRLSVGELKIVRQLLGVKECDCDFSINE
ncbi:hypothetical protein [Wenling hepe-like virus 3]|uniref:hypothetical protein n=1 Tax=Wenling hepe-like virus 3 TaxID=1923495 RepID=UPI00090B5E3B|nr:hypothetical protein [Wenling hepe-like virus 3]APG77815.1 hypothetical protein [Wenling hepe-like virus 3]